LYLVLALLKTVLMTEKGLSPGALIFDISLFLSSCSLVSGLFLTSRSIVKSFTLFGADVPTRTYKHVRILTNVDTEPRFFKHMEKDLWSSNRNGYVFSCDSCCVGRKWKRKSSRFMLDTFGHLKECLQKIIPKAPF